MKTIPACLLLGLFALVPAQQIGDANRDLVLSGNGSLAASIVNSQVAVGNDLVVAYQTQDSWAPVALFASPTAAIGGLTTPTNSIDLELAVSEIVLSGLDGGVSGILMRTNGTGLFSLTFPLGPGAAGLDTHLMMAHLSAMSADGFYVSQVHRLTTTSLGASSLNTQGTFSITLGDDDSQSQAVNFNGGVGLSFYGIPYTDVWIGSNGFLTFGGPDTDFVESTAALRGGLPRIAFLWDDHDPSAGGVVNVTSDPDSFKVAFANVPRVGDTTPQDFVCEIVRDSLTGITVTMDYAAISSTSALIGLSPGVQPGQTPALDGALDLSATNAPITGISTAYYELFGAANPIDVGGLQVVWLLDLTGVPLSQD